MPMPDDDGPVRIEAPPAIAAPASTSGPLGQSSPLLNNATQTLPGLGGAVTSSRPGAVINTPGAPRQPGARPVTIQPTRPAGGGGGGRR
jgi:hypothetical protein